MLIPYINMILTYILKMFKKIRNFYLLPPNQSMIIFKNVKIFEFMIIEIFI